MYGPEYFGDEPRVNDRHLIDMVLLVGQTSKVYIKFDLPFPYFRVRFGSYGWWGPWWGWN